MPTPSNYGRRPTDSPTTPRSEIDDRQAAALAATANGAMVDGKRKPLVPPTRSATTSTPNQ